MKNKWINNFEEIAKKKNLKGPYIRVCIGYAEQLLNNNVPVIFDLEHLSLLTGIKKEYIFGMIFSQKSFYRKFTIPKKDGSKREISAPQPSLKLIQRWIYDNILLKDNKDPSVLTINSITDYNALLKKLTDLNSLSGERILSYFDKRFRTKIEEWTFKKPINKTFKKSLLNGLNKLLEDKKFFDPEVFKDVGFDREIPTLYNRGLHKMSTREIRKFNRDVLEHFFPNEITRNKYHYGYHKAVYSFKKDKSIIHNAKIHLKSRDVFKMDIKDFFPSIKIQRIKKYFSYLGYTEEMSYYLAKICTLDNSLPQGAPTSPHLSNVLFYDLDTTLFRFARRNELRYSRYADDICFSGNISESKKGLILRKVRNVLKREGLELNEKKTVLAKKNQRQLITGIITNQKLGIKKEYERIIRQELYYITKYGIKNHMEHINLKKNNYLEHLKGKIGFMTSVSKRPRYLKYKETMDKIISGDIII